MIQRVIDGNANITLVEEFADIVFLFDIENFLINNFSFFENITFSIGQEIEEINSSIKLYNYFKINDHEHSEELNYLISEYIKDELISQSDSIYEFDVQFDESMNEDDYFEIIDGEVENLIYNIYSDLENSIEYFSDIDIDEIKVD